jgi:hypothetical protein
MKKSDVFDAMFIAVRNNNRRCELSGNHDAAFHSALTMSSAVSAIFGYGSSEFNLIESWAVVGTPSSFVGPLAVQP